jgi:hypothetical protein
VEIHADSKAAMQWVTAVAKTCEAAGLRYKLVQSAAPGKLTIDGHR